MAQPAARTPGSAALPQSKTQAKVMPPANVRPTVPTSAPVPAHHHISVQGAPMPAQRPSPQQAAYEAHERRNTLRAKRPVAGERVTQPVEPPRPTKPELPLYAFRGYAPPPEGTQASPASGSAIVKVNTFADVQSYELEWVTVSAKLDTVSPWNFTCMR